MFALVCQVIRVPWVNSPVKPGDHMFISHAIDGYQTGVAAVRGDRITTAQDRLTSVNDFWIPCDPILNNLFYYYFFPYSYLAIDFCRFCMVIRFFHPRHNGQWPLTSKDFLSQILSITLILFSFLNSWERASISPFECSVLNRGTTGTIFITSLVWCCPWLGSESGTSHTRSQHYTTRLSRRR